MKGKHGRIRKHARKRASQRVGLPFLDHRRHGLISAVRKGYAQFLERQSNRVTKWRYIFPDTDIPIIFIYDKMRGDIVTMWVDDSVNDPESVI